MLKSTEKREYKMAIGKWIDGQFRYKVYSVSACNKSQATKLAKAAFRADGQGSLSYADTGTANA